MERRIAWNHTLFVSLCWMLTACGDSTEDRLRAQQALEAEARGLADRLIGVSTESETAASSLVFRLQFSSAADLDLYVTDPMLETVYFANHESDTGGRLTEDVRCRTAPGADAAVRLEEVVFTEPFAGQYRVGVDLPERCDGGNGPAAFALSVQGAGVNRITHGTVAPQHFEPVILEFELEGQ